MMLLRLPGGSGRRSTPSGGRAHPPGAVVVFLLLLVAASSGSVAAASGASLRVAAVQLSVSAEMFGSLEAYRARIKEKVQGSLAGRPDLIVFPEYTAAFLALIPYCADLAGASSVAQGLERIQSADPLVGNLHDLFVLNSGWVERALEEVFGGLARQYRVAILAGSYFAWAGEDHGVRLVNRAVVFGADGRRIYQQDKVYLTRFEEELLGLSAGRLSAARSFPLAGARVGVTICRDSFFPDWEEQLADSDLWVDIKANGAPYTQEERQAFQRALPARIASGEVPFGLTVCLTGAFLDLLWEGESSLVRKVESIKGAAPTAATMEVAASPQAEETLMLEVPLGTRGR